MPTIDHLLRALEGSALATAIRGETGWGWLFPQIETVHVLALATVFGSIAMVDLRLLGFGARRSAVSAVSAEWLPLTWTAYGVAACAGTLLFISKAHTYFHNPQFEFKFLCMLLAGANMLVFHLGAYRHVRHWDSQLPPPPPARLAGALSILLWVGVIFFGRWTGFTT